MRFRCARVAGRVESDSPAWREVRKDQGTLYDPRRDGAEPTGIGTDFQGGDIAATNNDDNGME